MRNPISLLIVLLLFGSTLQAGESGPALFMPVPALPAPDPAPLETKSKGKAFMLSFLLPGLGEYYVGARTKAKVFFAAELTLWLTYAGFITYREWRVQDYRAYAAAHANVDLQGKESGYFIDIGNYDSIEEYNAAKLRARELSALYDDVDAYYWSWRDREYRYRFEELRISADRADNRALFVLGAIFANHVVSAVDAVWSAHKHQSGPGALDWSLRFGDGAITPYISLNLVTRF